MLKEMDKKNVTHIQTNPTHTRIILSQKKTIFPFASTRMEMQCVIKEKSLKKKYKYPKISLKCGLYRSKVWKQIKISGNKVVGYRAVDIRGWREED